MGWDGKNLQFLAIKSLYLNNGVREDLGFYYTGSQLPLNSMTLDDLEC